MAEIALRKPISEPVATYGGALGTGVLLGWVATTRPAWATGFSLLAGGAGAVGSLMLKGFPADISEGMGAAALGALGASLPRMLGGGAARRVTGAPAPKQIGAPTNVVGESIARQVKSAVEI